MCRWFFPLLVSKVDVGVIEGQDIVDQPTDHHQLSRGWVTIAPTTTYTAHKIFKEWNPFLKLFLLDYMSETFKQELFIFFHRYLTKIIEEKSFLD